MFTYFQAWLVYFEFNDSTNELKLIFLAFYEKIID